uniref:Post-SET domain-containing protein n=1 Tax=Romanomermis culicivorax TaxID=13658 RepID=A0A915KKP5_ROMCU
MLFDCTIFIKLMITIEIICNNLISSLPTIQKVDCYCTEEKCLRGACDSHTCLIGVKNNVTFRDCNSRVKEHERKNKYTTDKKKKEAEKERDTLANWRVSMRSIHKEKHENMNEHTLGFSDYFNLVLYNQTSKSNSYQDTMMRPSGSTINVILFDTGRVVRSCADDEDYRMSTESCYRNAEDWSEVCSCGSHLCNSFAFLRSKLIEMDENSPSRHNQLQQQADTASDMLQLGSDSDTQDSARQKGPKNGLKNDTVRMISPAYGIKMPIELAQSLLSNKNNNSNKNAFEDFSSFMEESSAKIDDNSKIDLTNIDSNNRRLLHSSSLLSSDDYSNMIVISRDNDPHPTNEKRKNKIVNQSSLILVLIIVPLALALKGVER